MNQEENKGEAEISGLASKNPLKVPQQINPHALTAKWRSKADIYRYFTQKKQYLLPTYDGTTMGKPLYF